jgi:DNA polymerase-3 subunit chi
MPEVEFHTALADAGDYAVRLLGKAWRRQARVLLIAPVPRLQAAGAALWQRVPGEFLAHAVLPGAADAVLRRSRLWLASDLAQAEADAARCAVALPSVVVNLGATVPRPPWAGCAAVERVIELVGRDEDDVAAGRERWRAWRALGCEVRHLTTGAGPAGAASTS